MVCLTYSHVLEANTGHRIANPKSFNRSKNRIKDASYEMAYKLEDQGIPAFRAGRMIHAISDISGDVEVVATEFRNILLIPAVAKSKRSQTIKDLQFFIENHKRADHFRYLVATSGERVPLEDAGALRERRSVFLPRLRKFMSESSQRWGVRFLYRGDEYTFNEEGAHYHENLLYYPSRKLSVDEWQAFLQFARIRLGNVWIKDAGKLKNPREVVKYICKLSGDSEHIRASGSSESWGADELTGPELAWLYNETVGGHSSQPLGEFADWLASIRGDRKKVVGVKNKAGDTALRLMQKPTASKKPKTITKARNYAENIVLNRSLPSPDKKGVFSPKTLVLNYTQAPFTGGGVKGLALIKSNQSQAKMWAECRGFIFNNTTRSVRHPTVWNKRIRHMNLALHRKQEQQKREQRQRKQILRQYKHVSRSDIVIAGTHAKQSMKRYRQYKHVSGVDLVVAGGFGFRP